MKIVLTKEEVKQAIIEYCWTKHDIDVNKEQVELWYLNREDNNPYYAIEEFEAQVTLGK